MNERELQVVELLRRRLDWVPGPRSWTGSVVAQGGSRGEQATEWFPCPRCSGNRPESCEMCKGAGRVKGDPYTVDAGKSAVAVGRERVTGEAESVRLRRDRDGRELRRLELAALHREGLVAPGEREAWELAKQALYRSGSFAELDKALARLERESAYDRAALEVVYGYDSPLRTVGSALQTRADAAVGMVAGWMPVVIRVPERVEPTCSGTGRWANGDAQRRRDREIWRLHTVDGLNREQIARRLGLDRSTVSRVLAPKTEAA
jgi:hypothetical protein